MFSWGPNFLGHRTYRKFENSIHGTKNFSVAWIVGTAYENLSKVMKSDACDVTLSVYPHRAGLKICLTTVGIEPTTFGKLATQSNITSISFT
jgi:hypothetical protein